MTRAVVDRNAHHSPPPCCFASLIPISRARFPHTTLLDLSNATTTQTSGSHTLRHRRDRSVRRIVLDEGSSRKGSPPNRRE